MESLDFIAVYESQWNFERQTARLRNLFGESFLIYICFCCARMPRRGGGKRIRMDDPVPMEYEEEMYRGAG